MTKIISSIFETLRCIVLIIYYMFEAFIKKFCCAPKKVAGEIVLITGSANGIGKQIALNFASLGAILVLWDIDEEHNKETAELAKRNGALAVYTYKCDCSKPEEIYAVADQVKKEVGDVNILINNAGIVTGKNFLDIPDSKMVETLDVNFKAHFWTCKAFLPAMIACNHGHLVSISSEAGTVGANKLSDYCASKAAVIGFLESVAFELQAAGKKGIKTTIVCPYYVHTRLTVGVKTTRPCLLPILDAECAGRKIVDSILKEKFYLFTLPVTTFSALKVFFPRKALFVLVQYLGIYNNMDDYIGYGHNEEKKND
ncbi:epidermal retinol dehydrogenase 2-like [Eublepharis macularius]|uniref:Epidermal retinol dehydrogenase 2-like n=1 Tax=Eublepharis macularius TaxID=481883 RepID=A0AA97JR38_EUBMA|nr:epidermal retinol dehydrogenase 2-like [Eublepharis macularius]XP_054841987.1 epidermal retinol dehydrogenase 2-like [Eublepharis macularius]XP_054841988.1 epidermal retinol dehydrogenase 2-like [Eublepharis macularius]